MCASFQQTFSGMLTVIWAAVQWCYITSEAGQEIPELEWMEVVGVGEGECTFSDQQVVHLLHSISEHSVIDGLYLRLFYVRAPKF